MALNFDEYLKKAQSSSSTKAKTSSYKAREGVKGFDFDTYLSGVTGSPVQPFTATKTQAAPRMQEQDMQLQNEAAYAASPKGLAVNTLKGLPKAGAQILQKTARGVGALALGIGRAALGKKGEENIPGIIETKDSRIGKIVFGGKPVDLIDKKTLLSIAQDVPRTAVGLGMRAQQVFNKAAPEGADNGILPSTAYTPQSKAEKLLLGEDTVYPTGESPQVQEVRDWLIEKGIKPGLAQGASTAGAFLLAGLTLIPGGGTAKNVSKKTMKELVARYGDDAAKAIAKRGGKKLAELALGVPDTPTTKQEVRQILHEGGLIVDDALRKTEQTIEAEKSFLRKQSDELVQKPKPTVKNRQEFEETYAAQRAAEKELTQASGDLAESRRLQTSYAQSGDQAAALTARQGQEALTKEVNQLSDEVTKLRASSGVRQFEATTAKAKMPDVEANITFKGAKSTPESSIPINVTKDVTRTTGVARKGTPARIRSINKIVKTADEHPTNRKMNLWRSRLDPEKETSYRVWTEIETAERGQRFPINPPGRDTEVVVQKSSFPDWVPAHLRSRQLFDRVMDTSRPITVKEKRALQLREVIENQINDRLGVKERWTNESARETRIRFRRERAEKEGRVPITVKGPVTKKVGKKKIVEAEIKGKTVPTKKPEAPKQKAIKSVEKPRTEVKQNAAEKKSIPIKERLAGKKTVTRDEIKKMAADKSLPAHERRALQEYLQEKPRFAKRAGDYGLDESITGKEAKKNAEALLRRHKIDAPVEVHARITDALDNGDLLGVMYNNKIGLAAKTTKFAGEHEALHLVIQNTDKIPHFKGFSYKKLIQNWKDTHPGVKAMSDLDVEEEIAKGFEKYVRDRGQGIEKTKGPLREYFSALYDFVKRMVGAYGDTSVQGFYKQLSEGRGIAKTKLPVGANAGLMKTKVSKDGVMRFTNIAVDDTGIARKYDRTLRSADGTFAGSKAAPKFKSGSDDVDVTELLAHLQKATSGKRTMDTAKAGRIVGKTAASPTARKVPSSSYGAKVAGFDNAVKSVTDALKKAKPLRKKQEELYSAERSRRLGAAVAVGKSMRGEKGFYGQLSKLKGELPKVEFETLRKTVTQDHVDELFQGIRDYKGMTEFEKITAQGGLLKMMGADGGQVPTNNEIRLLSEIFPPDFIKAVLQKRTPMRKLWEGTGSVLNIPRTLMSTLDFSASGRQALPLMGTSSWWKNFPKQFHYAFSEKAYQNMIKEVKARPTYLKMRESGLAITDITGGLSAREEQFMSDLPERVPLMGKLVRGSNRAYSGFLNKLRADQFDVMYRYAQKRGQANPKSARQIADFVNSATGRGSLGKHLEKAAPILNATFFSPRLMASRVNILLRPDKYIRMEPAVRRQAVGAVLRTAGIAAVMLTLAEMAGAKVGKDPRSSDFLKIKVGNTRYDVLGGFQQYMVLLSRIATGKSISSTTGKEFTYGEGYKPMTRLGAVGRFFESKEAPVVSYITSALRGSNAIGEEFDPKKEAVQRFYPMIFQDMQELYKERDLAGILMSLPGFFGYGTQTYGMETTRLSATKQKEYDKMVKSGVGEKDARYRIHVKEFKDHLNQTRKDLLKDDTLTPQQRVKKMQREEKNAQEKLDELSKSLKVSSYKVPRKAAELEMLQPKQR